jgi:cyclopropane fatty-acyl-phospholipid synthase-like methyltransferase
MIDTSMFLESFLQKQRFGRVKPYIQGDVCDFGGNKGELEKYVTGSYTLVDYDHSPMEGKTFDTIISLAVVEHIEVDEVYRIFGKFKRCLRAKGSIFITTPTPASRPVLETLAGIGLLDKANIEEHKHYWTKEDISKLAQETGFTIAAYKKFQLGFNQQALIRHA